MSLKNSAFDWYEQNIRNVRNDIKNLNVVCFGIIIVIFNFKNYFMMAIWLIYPNFQLDRLIFLLS